MSSLARAVVVAFVLGACHSAGPYGYAPQYVSATDEDEVVKAAREYDPVMYGREPETWRKSKTSLFGVVTGRAPGPGGAAYLTLTVRRLAPRNLCSNAN